MSETEGRETTTTSTVRVRRAPKYPAFIIVGGAVGVIVSMIITSLFEFDESTGPAATLGYFALYGLVGGILLGSLLALILDRVTMRRARNVEAETTTIEAPPIEGIIED